MGLGSTTKKIQTIADKAEQVYAQVDEVRKQLEDLRGKVDTTHETVETLEVKHEQNRAILEALAEEQGIDVEEVITEAAIDDAEESESEGTESGEPNTAPNVGDEDASEPDEPAPTGSIDADEGTGTETS